MKDTHVYGWMQAESPLIWVETIYAGDNEKMQRDIGFRYGGHYYISENQKTTCYQNIESGKAAKKIGFIKYKDPEFIRYFCKKTREIEKKLKEIANNLAKADLSKKDNNELIELFREFFDEYSNLVGFYRFCRPEFYEGVVEELRAKLPEPKDKNLGLLLENKFDKIKVDDKIKEIAKGLKEIGKRRFEMHNTWVSTFNNAKKLFEEIGKRTGLSLIEVQNCTSREIIDALDGKEVNKKEIKERVKHFRFDYGNGFFKVSIPKEKISEETKINELKGKPACQGKTRGTVKLLTESLTEIKKEFLEKIPEGSIIVTVMTSPDMMPAVRKAGAIVTDEGGLLCHAAIVARELRIPCIVGTGNATKILKDGDKVEVDAEKGIVRKLT